MKKLVNLYYDVDDFCKVFIPQWQKQLLEDGTLKRQRDPRMTMSEIMTIVINFYMSHYRYFKIIILVMFIYFIKKIGSVAN